MPLRESHLFTVFPFFFCAFFPLLVFNPPLHLPSFSNRLASTLCCLRNSNVISRTTKKHFVRAGTSKKIVLRIEFIQFNVFACFFPSFTNDNAIYMHYAVANNRVKYTDIFSVHKTNKLIQENWNDGRLPKHNGTNNERKLYIDGVWERIDKKWMSAQ